ncbi:MAG: NUDIX domain-containing protein [Bacteroidales bacterium]|nr:NUDIX domain-containing protein [Bacteroidales bacterium]
MKVSYKYHTFDVPLNVLRCLKRRMRWVRAAGGIVTDDGGDMLLIRRNGRWDLPKGKVEAGETLLQAALRETKEETGIKVIVNKSTSQQDNESTVTARRPVDLLTCGPVKTYHVFNLYGGWHLKQTSWFPMHAAGKHPHGTPQDEEGITEVVWVSPDEWFRRLQSSYGTLRTLSTLWQNRHSS